MNDLQEVLLSKYVEILNKPEHQNLLHAINNKDNKLSNIHLGFVPEHYESAEHKILIVLIVNCMNSGKPLVVVDYAHTPDALEKALSTLQEIKPQGAALWCVFGCGGNRDRGKRPLMGTAAVQGADKVVVTSDNPRLENPQDIINDILPAVPVPECVEADRAAAIRYAVERAAANDIVLIAGKGHENYQDMQGVKHHFSDFEVAEKALAERI